MKNRYSLKIIVSGALMMCGLMSCNPLGIEPTTMVDEDRFWENAQLSRSYINQFYTWTPVATGATFQSEQWTDNCVGNIDSQFDTYRQYSFYKRQYDALTGITGFSGPWSGSYKNIRATNLGLEKIGSSNVVLENDKKQMLAECYFFRAWNHFELEQYWGAVPYVDKVLTIFDETMLPRCPREKLFDYILADLDEAIRLFKESSNVPDKGMINLDVANAIKSRIALYAACAADASAKSLYSFDDSAKLFSFTKPSTTYYQIALNAAKEVLGKYSLEPKYEDLFVSETSYKSTESIWPMMFNLNNRAQFNPTGLNGPNTSYYGGSEKAAPLWGLKPGLFPTQDLADCYYQKDAADGKWKQWWKTKQAIVDMNGTVDEKGNYNGSSANYRELMYGERDARFYATITYDGSYMGPQKDMYQIQTWLDNSNESSDPKENSFKYSALHTGYRGAINYGRPAGRCETITGYYLRKYSHFDKFNADGTLNSEQRTTCYFLIRYAEVLLNYAEAAYKLGDQAGALVQINSIRHRAGLDDFNTAIVGHDLWTEYKLQRRVEFAFEAPGHRYFDLLRWGESDGKSIINELNGTPKAVRIFRKGIESQSYDAGIPVKPGEEGYFVPRVQTLRYDSYPNNYDDCIRKFNHARYYFLPFSESMMTSYQGLIQNPGWTNFNYEK